MSVERFRRAAGVAAVLACALVVGACEPAQPAPVEEPAPDPALEGVRAARDALGEPMVALAEALLAAAKRVDELRHDVERGEPMRDAVEAADGLAGRIRDEAARARAAGEQVGGDTEQVEAAAAHVAATADGAMAVADAIDGELAGLGALAEVDLLHEEVVAEWSEAGSQSQRRSALADLSRRIDGLTARIDRLQVPPEGCEALVAHRERWNAVLRERTVELARSARPGGGARYSELLDAYVADPFGEDRRAADAAERPCWAERSAVAQAGAAARADVERLEALLNP